MNNLKKCLSLIAVLLLATATFAVSLPASGAVTPTTNRSFVYIGVTPNIVGVGQQVIVVTWTQDMPPDIGETSGKVASPNFRAGWNNPMIVTVTDPEGKNTTLQMPRTDPVGATWVNYVPKAPGTYMLQAYFPGEWKNATDSTGKVVTSAIWYTPDYSEPINLTVQNEATQSWQETPLPTDYWSRPLNSANRDWYSLAGNWLGGAANQYPIGSGGGPAGFFGPGSSSMTDNFAYGKGTETSHIIWTTPYYAGGLMDERFGQIGYQTAHYQGLGFSAVVLNGQIHYSPRMTAQGAQGWKTLDLYTGATLNLDYNVTAPSLGQIYNYESPNQHGGFSYLWRTTGVTLPETVKVAQAKLMPDLSVVRTGGPQMVSKSQVTTGTLWEMLDGFTGKTICYISNVSSTGTAVYGKDGSILYYNIADIAPRGSPTPNYRLTVWNSSAGTMVASQNGTGYWQWRPAGGDFGGADPYFGTGQFSFGAPLTYTNVHNGALFYSLNVSVPSMLGPRNSILNQTYNILGIRQDEFVIVGHIGQNNEAGVVKGHLISISLKPGEAGKVLWDKEFTPPSSAGEETVSLTGVYPDDGMFLFQKATTMVRYGYSLDTMSQVWESEPEVQFQYYGMGQNVYNGTLYSAGYGGVITAYNVKTGDVLWTYEPRSIGTESAYGGYYPTGVVMISDGKLYTVTGEHSPTQPLFRGPNLRCIDASDGTEIWSILGFFGGMSPTEDNILMADGILVGLNLFDNSLYAFGKGPSGTTVDASPKASIQGDRVVVEGTVTDQSEYGRRNTNGIVQSSLQGTPAISDADMSAWMEYKFMQQEKPADAKGVSVDLNAIDPNGNYVHIGNTTSDINGKFGVSFVPEVSGDYQIIATFAGSKAYGPSSSSTFITVADAPEGTATPTSQQGESVADTYFIPAIAGLFLLNIIVAIVLALLIRKRP